MRPQFSTLIIGALIMSVAVLSLVVARAVSAGMSLSPHINASAGETERNKLAPDCGPNWEIIPSPIVTTTTAESLVAIAVVSANDIWAVGSVRPTTYSQTRTEHWDGTQWSIVPSPNVGTGHNYLTGVAAVTTNNVWAVG